MSRALRALALFCLGCSAAGAVSPRQEAAPLPPVLSEIDRRIREEFWDPALKGVDWGAAVARAASELTRAQTPRARDEVYDHLLSTLSDSHTFRVPPGFPERRWATAGLRIGRDGDGYAVKGVLPGSSAEREGLRTGDRVLSVDGKPYGSRRVTFRDLFFVFEGLEGSSVAVTWKPASSAGPKKSDLKREPEPAGDALVWKSARVIDREKRSWGYLRLWGISSETALAVVDLLLDRDEAARLRPELRNWNRIEGLLLDVRGNSGGYDPNILTTFLRGQWSAGDYAVITREGRRIVPPAYVRLPVALLVNSGTASAGEALALKFRTHRIGPIVGEETAGMASGGAAAGRLSDGSTLWLSRRAIEDLEGKSYEGRGITPDVSLPDRPPASPGAEEAIVEAGIRALGSGLEIERFEK